MTSKPMTLLTFALVLLTATKTVTADSCWGMAQTELNQIPNEGCRKAFEFPFKQLFIAVEQSKCCHAWDVFTRGSPEYFTKFCDNKTAVATYVKKINSALCTAVIPPTQTPRESVCHKKAKPGIDKVQDADCKTQYDYIFNVLFDKTKANDCCYYFNMTYYPQLLSYSCGDKAEDTLNIIKHAVCFDSSCVAFSSLALVLTCLLGHALLITN